MDGKDLITVVIPNYNGIDFLRECLDSLCRGTILPRIIVVDNGSSDDSCRMLQQVYPQVLLIRLPVNTGFCHAVNTGLMLTRTPYAFLLNNDTRTSPDCLEKLLAVMESDETIFSVQALMLSMEGNDTVDDAGDLYCAFGWAFARAKGKKRSSVKGKTTRIFSSCGGAALYRMRVFEKIGWFDERHFCYLEDVDIGWRARIYGYKNKMEPLAIVYHKGSATSGSRYNPFKETMTAGNNAYLLYKNMPALMYWVNAPLWKLGEVIKRRYFWKKGLASAYDEGLARGVCLKEEAKEQDAFRAAQCTYKKGTLQEEACVSLKKGEKGETDPAADLLPLYLGGKVPFLFSNLLHYIVIEGELLVGCVRRLWN